MQNLPTGPAVAGARTNAAKVSAPLQSSDLFRGQKSVVIEHNGTPYRLQTTKLGKLILMK